jgi:hypothetical protein
MSLEEGRLIHEAWADYLTPKPIGKTEWWYEPYNDRVIVRQGFDDGSVVTGATPADVYREAPSLHVGMGPFSWETMQKLAAEL